MVIKAVIFDIGGVLVDADLESYAALAAPAFATSPEDIRLAVQTHVGQLETGKITSDIFWKQVGDFLVKNKKGVAASPRDTQGLWRQALNYKFRLNKKMMELCWAVQSKGVVLAALSNTIKDHATELASQGVYQPFKPLILSCEVGLRKPDPAIYKLCLSKVGQPAKECLFVDDSAANIEAAKKAGMQTHHFTTLNPLLSELQNKWVLTRH